MGNDAKDTRVPALIDRRDGGFTLTVWTLSGFAFLAACGGGGGGGGANSNIRPVVSGGNQPTPTPDWPVLTIESSDMQVSEAGTSTTRDSHASGQVRISNTDNRFGHVLQARGTESSFTDGLNSANSGRGTDIVGTYGTLYLNSILDGNWSYELYSETTARGAALQALTSASRNIQDVFTVRVDNDSRTEVSIIIHVMGADDVPTLTVVGTDTSVSEGGTYTTRDAYAHGSVTISDDTARTGHDIQGRTGGSFTDGSNTANSNKGTAIAGTYGTLYLKADYTWTYELYHEASTKGVHLQALTSASRNIQDVFTIRVDGDSRTQTSITIHVMGADDSGDGGTSFTIPGNLASTRSTPLYPNSVVSNDHDFIHTDDPSAFSSLTYIGTRDNVEMPDSRKDPQDPQYSLRDDGVYIFEARYSDGTAVGMWANSDFGPREAAQMSAEPVAEAVGKLPTFMRSTLRHVVIHDGDETAFGEHAGHFFVIYSDNILTRISNHDLEETVFHESVHATLDKKYREHGEWRKAQQADGGYITEYAASRITEDLAESALFAWAMLMHPGRLPEMVEQQARAIMPNRLAFFEEMFKFEGLTLPQPTAGAAEKEAADMAAVGAIDNIEGHDAAETGFQLVVDII